MKVEVDSQNYVIICQQFGGRIIELVLGGHLVIKASQPFDDTASGHFLMFPWISKAPQNPYEPHLKNQYHGFSINSPRSIEIDSSNKQDIKITIKLLNAYDHRHNFVQNYALKKSQLKIHITVLQNENDKLPYCFGYHPYLQIDQQKIDNLSIKSDIKTLLQFDENILPIYPFKEREISITSSQTYNNLFKGGSYVELTSNKGVHLKIESDMPFWQIYNPPQRTKIAIEPVSFCGNLYNIFKQDPTISLPKSGTVAFNVWEQ